MLQALGHVTESANLRSALADVGGVDTRWLETIQYDESGLVEQLPGLPAFVRAGARGLLEVRQTLRQWPADVLFFNPQNAAMFCQWYMWRLPTILMTDATPIQHDAMADKYQHTPDRNPAVRALKHRANMLNFHLARAVVPFCTWVRDSLVRDYGVPVERTHVLSPGIDTRRWRPAATRTSRERVRLLFVGASLERKGGRLLLEVFRNLGLHDRAEVHLVTRDPVESAAGVFAYHGLQSNSSDLIELYQQADVFVLPTLADCFPNAALEATAAGLPVISSDLAGLPDIVEHGHNGYLLDPGDGRALGAALCSLIDDAQRRRAFGQAARERAVARFDSRTNAARMVALARAVHLEHAGRA